MKAFTTMAIFATAAFAQTQQITVQCNGSPDPNPCGQVSGGSFSPRSGQCCIPASEQAAYAQACQNLEGDAFVKVADGCINND
ncbi:hypothetical protein LX36DRAFT_660450 [Colletotrichum falcatum]|nr:hypothetical protein LX36DRAFT_660450 [Colletotrichum falcatum]